MARVSEKTFEIEGKSFRNIQGIFWGSECEYPIDPFSGILDGFNLGDMQVASPDFWSDTEEIPQGRDPEIRLFRRGGLFLLDRKDAMKRIGDAAGKSGADFAEALWDLLGIDISEELERSANSGLPSGRSLQDLEFGTDAFGTDAFGTYCPWQAFGRSSETPWGFYLFYRPYVERVRTPVMNSERWFEEALAQAVVLRSNYVKRTLGIVPRIESSDCIYNADGRLRPFRRHRLHLSQTWFVLLS